jgi:hypothetical protein
MKITKVRNICPMDPQSAKRISRENADDNEVFKSEITDSKNKIQEEQ